MTGMCCASRYRNRVHHMMAWKRLRDRIVYTCAASCVILQPSEVRGACRVLASTELASVERRLAATCRQTSPSCPLSTNVQRGRRVRPCRVAVNPLPHRREVGGGRNFRRLKCCCNSCCRGLCARGSAALAAKRLPPQSPVAHGPGRRAPAPARQHSERNGDTRPHAAADSRIA